jgi:mevalonate kinase
LPAISASAPGKLILFGEHAVVYDRPAIAVPIEQVQVKVYVVALPMAPPGEVHIEAPAINLISILRELPPEHPIAIAIHATAQALGIRKLPAMHVRIVSTIPVAAGMGSGAAVSVALVRGISTFLGRPLPDEKVSSLAFLVEKKHHGNPSGIDNSVIAYHTPIYFQRGKPIETLHIAESFTLIIADSGVRSPTSIAVGNVRKRWQQDPSVYESLFDAIGDITQKARLILEKGPIFQLGELMDQNHTLLQQIGVSCPELDALVATARLAGAIGAKLSGGGMGGNIFALATPHTSHDIALALTSAGAVCIRTTTIQPRNLSQEG